MLIKNEYPRPQFVRNNWQNLNGTWQFAYDDENCGLRGQWFGEDRALPKEIVVPFVYQSRLSGIEDREVHETVWYKRDFQVENRQEKEEVILHFGAVDYEATVFLNGHQVMAHKGGHTPFSVNITPFLREGSQHLVVRVWDPGEDEMIPRGKQSWEKESKGIWYTNSTGIWQTVWLETVSPKRLEQVKFTPLFDEGKVTICCIGTGIEAGDQLICEIKFGGILVSRTSMEWQKEMLEWDADLVQNKIFRTNFHDDGWSWTPEHPNLFTVEFCVADKNQKLCDRVESYFGFRKVHTEKGMVFLNNKPYYQKLVLDQGYWPEGLLTAPNDQALEEDIRLSMAMGFNGCRKHQKMEDPRFLYWADKLGYLVWGECASPPMFSQRSVANLMEEWTEIVERDYNHPCIIVWVPLNESWGVPHIHSSPRQQHFSQAMYHYLHALDHTRLVISNDGWEMTETDICAIHNYMHGQKQETEKFDYYKETLSTRETLINHPSTPWDIYARGFGHRGEPILLTEFGGIGFDVKRECQGWGYTSVNDEREFLEDYARIMDAVYASRGLWGFCYTQLTDVEQEINGILTYDRKPKCRLEEIRNINQGYHRSRLEG